VSTDDERHQAGPGERLTVDQANKQDELDSDEASEHGGEVGEAIRRGADDEDAFDRDADESGEVGEAIRRSTEEP
jgi:hypothetical protein